MASLATASSSSSRWVEIGTNCRMYGPAPAPAVPGQLKVAAFDLDSTLVTTRSGRVHATSAMDWCWWDSRVPAALAALGSLDWHVVIFTNQKLAAHRLEAGLQRIAAVVDSLAPLPVHALVATADDRFRKPSPDMLDEYLTRVLQCGRSDLHRNSFFVGDAAGRPAKWDGKATTKKDFSNSDRQFAAECGLQFHTPETYFLGQPEWTGADDIARSIPTLASRGEPTIARHRPAEESELVILVGCPASGKSTFAQRYFVPHGYVYVSQDVLGTKPRCLTAVGEALAVGKSVVLDNTNPKAEDRIRYIKLAAGADIPARCIWLQTPVEVAKVLNMRREAEGVKRHVPAIAYSVYYKNLQEPTVAEGFASVEKLEFDSL